MVDILQNVREDDFVEYFLFTSTLSFNKDNEDVELNELLNKCNQIVQNLSKNYLWHKDSFKLNCRPSITNKLVHLDEESGNDFPHLYGITHYGDYIEDEWFIVYLLYELTKHISDLIIKVVDSDGEFLLIEAADFLPSWANPDICENRVFISNGKIHILKPENMESASSLELNKAILLFNEQKDTSIASAGVQNAIFDKISGYPNKIKDNLHLSKVYVPIAIAAILKKRPELISAAVHAFCDRDPLDVKVCKAMKYFPPENRVYTNVLFTKCLYAMMINSKYIPDKRTGWYLPLINSKEYKSHNLGMKIACGFEILVSQANPSSSIDNDKSWQNYLKSLKEKDYFNGLLEHSKEYNNLLNKAKEFYTNHRDSMYYSPKIGEDILNITRNLDLNNETFNNADLQEEDDDSWLSINPEELDKFLQEKYGKKKVLTLTNNSDPNDFSHKLTSFLHHISDLDGAEFPDKDSPVRPPRNKKNKSKESLPAAINNDNKSPKINFDPNSFESAVQNILNFVIPEDDSWNLESDSEMSDYEDDNFVKEESYSEKNKMVKYMEEMDRELASTTLGESFVKKNNGDNFEDIENFNPVDIDMNALKNILESYKSQMGDPGPSSNMLGPMGIHFNVTENDKE